MHRLGFRLITAVLAAGTVAAMGACGGGDEGSPTDPPPTTSVTESFSGTLTVNGGITHSFTVTASGGITALLTVLTPDQSTPVGLSLGTYNGSICQVVLANDVSIQGSVVVGQTNTTGEFCVRIYDASGTLPRPQDYVIEVSHQVAP